MTHIEVEFITLTEKPPRKNHFTVHDKMNKATSLRDLLTTLSSQHEEIKEMLGDEKNPTGHETVILVNGKYPSNGLSTELNDKDKVTILPVIAGG